MAFRAQGEQNENGSSKGGWVATQENKCPVHCSVTDAEIKSLFSAGTALDFSGRCAYGTSTKAKSP